MQPRNGRGPCAKIPLLKHLPWIAILLLIPCASAQEFVVQSTQPTFETILPKGYQQVLSRENPSQYVRVSGPEDWAKLTVTFVAGRGPLEQNPAGITLPEILPFVSLPANATSSFKIVRWKDYFIGSVEYHAVAQNLSMFGIAAVVPISGKAVTISISAPEPLEPELRKDFRAILSRLSGPSRWHSLEELRRAALLETVGKAGAGFLLLYLIAWAAVFRGHPLRAHVLRIAWLAATAILLFIPIMSPGETSLVSNLVVNGVLPLVCLLFASHRIKMGIEMS
jgi:hypothetical protein